MQDVKRCTPSGLAHRSAETETAVWVMIVILIGLAALAMMNLFVRVGG